VYDTTCFLIEKRLVGAGAPNPRCSRRRDLGRLAGWGWGVGEVSVSAVLVRAADLLRWAADPDSVDRSSL
jgi:hypothetical protein